MRVHAWIGEAIGLRKWSVRMGNVVIVTTVVGFLGRLSNLREQVRRLFDERSSACLSTQADYSPTCSMKSGV